MNTTRSASDLPQTLNDDQHSGYPPKERVVQVHSNEGHARRSSQSDNAFERLRKCVVVVIRKTIRVALLLTTGYSSTKSQTKYETEHNWGKLHETLLVKIENIGVVSGLLLASSSNLLIASDLRRMTYVTTMASIYGSTISIVSGLFCTWLLVGSHPKNVKNLLRHRLLFYYLYATPSLFGGASALAFFVAIGSWTWLDQAENDKAWAGRIFAILLSAVLMGNTMTCLVLGARNHSKSLLDEDPEATDGAMHVQT